MLLSKNICLCLNSAWQPIGVKSIQEGVSSLYAGSHKAISIEYQDSDFSQPLDMTPYAWEEWSALPIREYDMSIRSPRLIVRVPTVLIAIGYNKMPNLRYKLSNEGIRQRDKNVCQYTGKKLTKGQGSVDHVVPKSRGGKDSWTNMVYCDKKLNTTKSNKLLNELDLKLIRQPKEPTVKTVASKFNHAQHPDWKHFIY
jgi:5-methylcytosine-specific restriction endonuclease McrA